MPVAFHLFTVMMAILTLGLPRKLAPVPFLLGAIFSPFYYSWGVQAGPFSAFHILMLSAWFRMVCRRDGKLDRLGAVDWSVFAFILSGMAAYVALRQSTAAVVGALGICFNALGAYVFFRRSIRTLDDLTRVTKVLVVAAVALAVCVLIEQRMGRNLFQNWEFSELRDGHVRCQGPFGHPILAGAFGATLVPLFSLFWWRPRGKRWALAGCAASFAIVYSSACSGPVLTLLAAIGGLLMWPVRRYMRLLRWSLLFATIALHMVMKAPVWALIARVSIFGSSSSDHRFRLLDNFIRNFDDWWLFGSTDNKDWGWMTWDASNGFVRIGLDGGLITLILFFAVVVACFKVVGRARKAAVRQSALQRCYWGLGAALFAHLVALIGVNYWDQSIVLWYFLLAVIAATASPSFHRAPPDPQRGHYDELRLRTSDARAQRGGFPYEDDRVGAFPDHTA
jgi:hypothetical protein